MHEINYKYGTRYEFTITLFDIFGRLHTHRYVFTKYYPEDVKPFYSLGSRCATKEMRFTVLARIEHYLN